MRTWSLLAPLLLVSGCATPFNAFDVQPGTTRDAVLARMGRPTRIVSLPDGERLQYSLQPFGQYAWMVDLDRAGKVVRARQVLDEQDFHRIQPGWGRDEVEREFGPPATIDAVSSWPGPIMTYRWKDPVGGDMFYFVYLDRQGIVRRAHPGMEFHNAPDRQ
jgi:hypothetical protein